MPRFYPALEISWPSPPAQESLEQILAAIDDEVPVAVEDLISGQRIFFSSPESRDRALEVLGSLNTGWRFSSLEVSDEDWAERSQQALDPVSVGKFLIVPGKDLGGSSSTSEVLLINPSMGFGTGHHASTRLCLTLLQRAAVVGASVLDVGTGSGILAIAARRLGAGVVVAIDADPDALQSARENCELNDERTIEVRQTGLAQAAADLNRRFDVVLANLTGALIARHAGILAGLTADGGRLIASGFQIYEADDVAAALEEAGLGLSDRIEEEGWVGLSTIPTPSTGR